MQLQTRLSILAWISVTLLIATAMTGIYRMVASGIQRKAAARAAETAVAASHMVNYPAHASIQTPEDQSGPAYKMLRSQFEKFRYSHPGMRHVYTLVRTSSPHKLKFVVDVGVDPPILAQVGCPWYVGHNLYLLDAFQRPAARPSMARDRWGIWQSAYAPIRNPATGETAAIIGIDVSAMDAVAAQSRARQTIIWSFLPLAAFAVLASTRLGAMSARWAHAMAEQASAASESAEAANFGNVDSEDGSGVYTPKAA